MWTLRTVGTTCAQQVTETPQSQQIMQQWLLYCLMKVGKRYFIALGIDSMIKYVREH